MAALWVAIGCAIAAILTEAELRGSDCMKSCGSCILYSEQDAVMTDFNGFKGRAKKLDDVDLPRIGARIGVGEDELHAFVFEGGAGKYRKERVSNRSLADDAL